MQHKTMLVVPVFHDVCFRWLGSTTVLDRLLRKLEDVRDIDLIRIVTNQPHDNFKAWLTSPDRDVASLKLKQPASLFEVCLAVKNTAKDAKEYEAFVAVSPLFPCLNGNKINQAIHALSKGNDSAVSAIKGRAIMPEQIKLPRRIESDVPIVHDVCLALKSRVLTPANWFVNCVGLSGKSTEVWLTQFETLNYSTDEGLKLLDGIARIGAL